MTDNTTNNAAKLYNNLESLLFHKMLHILRRHFTRGALTFPVQVDESKSISEIQDLEKSEVIYVYPDKTDLEGNDQKVNPEEASSESVHSTAKQISNHSDDNRRNTGCKNDAYVSQDEIEISKL